MVAAVSVSDHRDDLLNFLNERPPQAREMKVIAELVGALYKVVSRWDVLPVIPKLLSLKGDSSIIPPGITVYVIKQNPELRKRVQEMLTAPSHYGARLLLYGAWPDEGLLEHLQDKYPGKFPNLAGAEKWVRDQWGIPNH
ncbi:MAG: hypothetical protein FJZ64_04375 [Chlamydiae bacterium]|nr:hypothetical protein [Chlamydiota bacterium]